MAYKQGLLNHLPAWNLQVAAKTFEELSSVHCKVRSSSLPPERGWEGSKTLFFQEFFLRWQIRHQKFHKLVLVVRGDSSRDLLIPQTLEVTFTAIEKVAFSPSQKGQKNCQVRVFFPPKKQGRLHCSDIGCALLLQDVSSRILVGQKHGEKIEGFFFFPIFGCSLFVAHPAKFLLWNSHKSSKHPKKKVINGLSGLLAPIRTSMDCWNVPARITSGQRSLGNAPREVLGILRPILFEEFHVGLAFGWKKFCHPKHAGAQGMQKFMGILFWICRVKCLGR